jgi:hypothetical protein
VGTGKEVVIWVAVIEVTIAGDEDWGGDEEMTLLTVLEDKLTEEMVVWLVRGAIVGCVMVTEELCTAMASSWWKMLSWKSLQQSMQMIW